MMIEKLQINNALRLIEDQLAGLNKKEGADNLKHTALTSQKENLLQWIAWMTANNEEAPITAHPEKECYEPSAALRHFWIGYFYEKTHVPFNIITYYSIPGCNLEIFRKTCETIVERHQILRTVPLFNADTPSLKQKILPRADLSQHLTITDIRDADNKDNVLDQHLQLARAHIFEYGETPSFQFKVLQYQGDDCFIIFNISHAIFDGFSQNIFTEEFKAIYNAYKQGTSPKLEALPVQFKDFCEWEAALHRKALSSIFEKYWFSQNTDRFPMRNLSTHFSGTALKDFSYRASLKERIKPYLKDNEEKTISAFYGVVAKAERTPAMSYRFTLDSNTFARCNAFCRKQQTTIYPLVLAVLNLLIYKRTGIDDIVIGANIAIRDRVELQKLLGFFVNTILIRNQVDEKKQFNGLFTDVILNISLASFFKYYTMSKLLDDMDIPFNSINTLFINMLPIQSGAVLTDFTSRHYNNNTLGYFDIDLHVQRYANGIEFSCNYNHSIYSSADITSLFDEFIVLLQLCLNHPELPVAQLLLSLQKRHR